MARKKPTPFLYRIYDATKGIFNAAQNVLSGDNDRKTFRRQAEWYANLHGGSTAEEFETVLDLTLREVIELMEQGKLPFDHSMTGNIKQETYSKKHDERQDRVKANWNKLSAEIEAKRARG